MVARQFLNLLIQRKKIQACKVFVCQRVYRTGEGSICIIFYITQLLKLLCYSRIHFLLKSHACLGGLVIGRALTSWYLLNPWFSAYHSLESNNNISFNLPRMALQSIPSLLYLSALCVYMHVLPNSVPLLLIIE